MKKYLVLFFAFFIICMPSFAAKLKNLPYKNIKDGKGVKCTENGMWTDDVSKKDKTRLVKNGSVLNYVDGTISYDTGCSYLFVKDGKLYGYSSFYTKFFEFTPADSQISMRELSGDEVKSLFGKFKIIKISDFSEYTNSYVFTREKRKTPVMVLNDTEEPMPNYVFSTNSVKMDRYKIGNAIRIKRDGMIQFSTYNEDSKSLPWFILLVR